MTVPVPAEGQLTFAEVRPIGTEGHTTAMLKGIQQRRERPYGSGNQLSQWGEIVQAVTLGEWFDMPGQYVITPRRALQALVLHLQYTGDRLLLKPFAQIPFLSSCPRR